MARDPDKQSLRPDAATRTPPPNEPASESEAVATDSERKGCSRRGGATFEVDGALDPLTRSLAGQQVRAAIGTSPAPPPATPADLEQLVSELVRRVAWGGDRRKGTARIELGSGGLAGATLVVHADRNELTIDLELPPGVPAEPWRDRLTKRLEGRGFVLRELAVR